MELEASMSGQLLVERFSSKLRFEMEVRNLVVAANSAFGSIVRS
jgi:hypothetical protein